MYTRLQQENKTRYKYTHNNRGDAQIAPMKKAPRAAQTILGLQEYQDPSNPKKTMTSRKTAHWEST